MSIISTDAGESLRDAVMSQLTWDPELAAERTARRVYVVHAVANGLQAKRCLCASTRRLRITRSRPCGIARAFSHDATDRLDRRQSCD